MILVIIEILINPLARNGLHRIGDDELRRESDINLAWKDNSPTSWILAHSEIKVLLV